MPLCYRPVTFSTTSIQNKSQLRVSTENREWLGCRETRDDITFGILNQLSGYSLSTSQLVIDRRIVNNTEEPAARLVTISVTRPGKVRTDGYRAHTLPPCF